MSVVAAFMVPHPPLIVPAVGKGSEAQIAETTRAYEQAAEEIAALAPETIVISSPHTVMYTDYFHLSPGKTAAGSFRDFGAPEVRFEETYDTELVEAIERLARLHGPLAGTLGEREKRLDHGTMVPLYFIRQRYSKGKLVRVGLSGMSLDDHYSLGKLIARAAEETGRRVVWVASGDLSHKLKDHGPYGYAPEGPAYDERIMDVCARAAFGELFDFDETFCEKAAECGHRSFVMMAGALDGQAVEARQLSHQDVTGVGYGICTFYPKGPDESRRFLDLRLEKLEKELAVQRDSSDEYVRLARQSLEHYVLRREYLDIPEGLPPALTETRAGAFVSLHKFGRLRGCIGTILPVTDCLAKEIIDNAVSAALRDPRFDPVRPDELTWLEVSVDVLGAPEPIKSMDQLDVKRYGVIVTRGRKKGLLLPDLEGVDTVEDQVAIARQKAGIEPGEPVQLERFEVIRHT